MMAKPAAVEKAFLTGILRAGALPFHGGNTGSIPVLGHQPSRVESRSLYSKPLALPGPVQPSAHFLPHKTATFGWVGALCGSA